jgi:UDP-N-acetylmuramoyl-tripeptide--D-alanyl-D-alanine ligase
LGRWTPYKGRGAREIIHLDPVEQHLTIELIDESYNANPTSMAAALEVLAAAQTTNDIGRVSKGRRIAIVGDMKELGPTAAELHASLADLPAIEQIDIIHCIGPDMQHLYDALPAPKRGLHCATSAEFADQTRAKLDSGDVVMAKGSLSMDLARVVDAIRKMGHPPLDNESGV